MILPRENLVLHDFVLPQGQNRFSTIQNIFGGVVCGVNADRRQSTVKSKDVCVTIKTRHLCV